MHPTYRPFLAFFTATLMLPMQSTAFYDPLSGQAVREAYFLGKRGGESVARILNSYTKFPLPSARFATAPEFEPLRTKTSNAIADGVCRLEKLHLTAA